MISIPFSSVYIVSFGVEDKHGLAIGVIQMAAFLLAPRLIK